MNTEKSILETINSWIKNSVTIKLITIGILILLLLIPTVMIREIIFEREQLNNEAIAEVSSKWANRQCLNGPILTIPVEYEYNQDDKIVTRTRYWHILPENLRIKSQVEPLELKRGIYRIVVYSSNLDFTGNFLIEKSPDPTHLKEIHYDQGFLTVGVTDMKGIEDQVDVNWDGNSLKVEPGSRIPNLISSGFTVYIPDTKALLKQTIEFAFHLDLQGSQNLSFIPVGSNTDVVVNSTWTSPSFNGNFLPDTRQLSDSGFEADWEILQLNRNYPQSWMDDDHSGALNASTFGVDLILPLDDYQKSIRSAKYGVMTIALTFLVFFLVEILNNRKIHPFQYILVGLALCLFYILLVSISEHTSFNIAYGVSAVGVVSMITLYAKTVFKDSRLTILLTIALVSAYGFLFITLQLADYALLMGSIGLSLILGATMYFTRNINWYNLNFDTN